MKTFPRCALFPSLAPVLSTVVATCLVPAFAFAGPDATPTPRPHHAKSSPPALRSEPPPPVVEQRTTITEDTTLTAPREDIIQPLRQREESASYRLGYRGLTSLGLVGSEADDKPVGYEQIYGPTPLRIYRRPGPPPPRRFQIDSEPVEEHPTPAPAPDASPAPSPLPAAGTTNPSGALPDAPAASSAPNGAPSPATSDPSQDAGVLPDPAAQASQNRNDEILSYFQRPRPTRQGPYGANNPPYANDPARQYGDPTYLQMPEQLPLPPSRATDRVVPK